MRIRKLAVVSRCVETVGCGTHRTESRLPKEQAFFSFLLRDGGYGMVDISNAGDEERLVNIQEAPGSPD